MFLLLILKLWSTGASLVAGHSTRDPAIAGMTESIAEQVAQATPPAEETAGASGPRTLVLIAAAANEDVEPAVELEPDDTGPLLLPTVTSRRGRTVRSRPPRRAFRVRSPALALRI